jgi:plastocyanin
VGVPRAGLRRALIAAGLAAAGLNLTAGSVAPIPQGGTITGVITTKIPGAAPLRATIDPEVCGAVPNEEVVVDAGGHVANAVVTVTGARVPAPAEVVLVNERCRFTPRVNLIRPNGTIKMTSHDPVLHTVHAAPDGGRALFNVSLPVPNLTLSKPVDRPGIVRLTCSTHTWMRGFLHVTEELSAVSGADGTFRLTGVPAGRQTLRIWHETLAAKPVTVDVVNGQTATVSLELTRSGS